MRPFWLPVFWSSLSCGGSPWAVGDGCNHGNGPDRTIRLLLGSTLCTSKSRSLVLAGLGYGVTIAALGWDFFTVILFSHPHSEELFLLWGPLVPFAIAAIAALLTPSPRWSAAVTTLIVLLLMVGAYLSFNVVRDEYSIFPYVFVLMGEAAVSFVLLLLVGIARIVLRRRLITSHAT